MGHRGAISLKNTSEIDTSNYCGAMDAYSERASPRSKPFTYPTSAENGLNNGAKYAEYMERPDCTVSERWRWTPSCPNARACCLHSPQPLRCSCGAAARAARWPLRYYSEALHSKLGIILSGWSCDFDYFVSCAENVLICARPSARRTSQCRMWWGRPAPTSLPAVPCPRTWRIISGTA
ncbi:unnamed protein product [Prorocentrum cordatum]|uniref:Uncharacterized protein n=1 Tax=Prorocentrum cordatum TaxID=2364126 RepID=A0ABN9Y1D4_9DINO|nr:unnamed protein product [Polarella glacialis]